MNANNEDLNKEEELKKEEVEEEVNNQNIDEDVNKEDSNSNVFNAKDDEIDDMKSKLARLQADFVNFKRRAEIGRASCRERV